MSDRVVLVTGGAQGIGFACVRRFFEDGYRVIIADIDSAEGARALSDLQADPSRAIFVECDVADKLQVHNLIAESVSHFGRVDVLINNAGVALAGGILDISEKDFDRSLGVNLRGAFLVLQSDPTRLSIFPRLMRMLLCQISLAMRSPKVACGSSRGLWRLIWHLTVFASMLWGPARLKPKCSRVFWKVMKPCRMCWQGRHLAVLGSQMRLRVSAPFWRPKTRAMSQVKRFMLTADGLR